MQISKQEQLKEIISSYRTMKENLHWWDDVDNQIDEELKRLKGESVKPEGEIDSNLVEEFAKNRNELFKLTAKEIQNNVDSYDTIITGLEITAGIGILCGVGAFIAAPSAALAVIAGTGRAVVAGGAWVYRGVAAGIGPLGRGLLPYLRHPLTSLAKGFELVRAHWYLRWAPVPLGLGFGLARTQMVAAGQKAKRESLVQPVPPEVLEKVRQRPASWEEGIKFIQQYPYDKILMEHLLPQLYHQVVTPEGALVLTHTLLETFSLSPSLDYQAKIEYGAILEREFEQAMQHFGTWVMTLDLTGAKASEESVFQAGKLTIQGHIVKPGIGDLIREMRQEKDQSLKIMALHEPWVFERIPDEMTQKAIAFRGPWINKVYSLRWGGVQTKLDDLDLYMEKTRQAFNSMRQDFLAKNPDVWQAFMSASQNWNSKGALVGLFGGPLFFKPTWTAYFKSIPFMMVGAWVSASYTAETSSERRLPITLCVPSYGSLCEELP